MVSNPNSHWIDLVHGNHIQIVFKASKHLINTTNKLSSLNLTQFAQIIKTTLKP